MKKMILFIIIAFLICPNNLVCQCDDIYVVNSQTQLNKIASSLINSTGKCLCNTLSNLRLTSSDKGDPITDLNLEGLKCIKHIRDELSILDVEIENNGNLKNIESLNKIWITGNEKLLSLDFSLVHSDIDHIIVNGNDNLLKLKLPKPSLGYNIRKQLFIRGNPLYSLENLDKINSIGNSLQINNTEGVLKMLFTNLQSIDSLIYISDNKSLSEIDISNISNYSIGRINIINNTSLNILSGPKSQNGTEGLQEIKSSLYIHNNSIKTSFTGFTDLKTIGWELYLADIHAEFPIFDNLTSIGDLTIAGNSVMENLDWLPSLSSINSGQVSIRQNNSLSRCSISAVCNLVNMATNSVEIRDNKDCCEYERDVLNDCDDRCCIYEEITISEKCKIFIVKGENGNCKEIIIDKNGKVSVNDISCI